MLLKEIVGIEEVVDHDSCCDADRGQNEPIERHDEWFAVLLVDVCNTDAQSHDAYPENEQAQSLDGVLLPLYHLALLARLHKASHL